MIGILEAPTAQGSLCLLLSRALLPSDAVGLLCQACGMTKDTFGPSEDTTEAGKDNRNIRNNLFSMC
jgi:hypothetical protein